MTIGQIIVLTIFSLMILVPALRYAWISAEYGDSKDEAYSAIGLVGTLLVSLCLWCASYSENNALKGCPKYEKLKQDVYILK